MKKKLVIHEGDDVLKLSATIEERDRNSRRIRREHKELLGCLVRVLNYLKMLEDRWNEDDEATYADWFLARQTISDVASVLAGFKVEPCVEEE